VIKDGLQVGKSILLYPPSPLTGATRSLKSTTFESRLSTCLWNATTARHWWLASIDKARIVLPPSFSCYRRIRLPGGEISVWF